MSARNRKITVAALAVLAAAAGSVYADPAVDGLLGTDYGAPIVTQVNPTQFGDSTLGQQGYANGSELNAAYGKISGGNLYVMITGNLESNFNHLDLFIDSVAGGQHTLVKNNVDVDFHALERMGENLDGSNASANTVIGPGLTFDNGFAADYYIGIAGGDQGGQYGAFANFATLPTAGNGTGTFLGGGAGQRVITEGTTGITVAIDNSNTAGVTGSDATNPTSATSGIEYMIPLAAIGNPTGPIKITAFVNGGGHDYVSNQVLGSLPSGYGNMGEPRNLDLSAQDGDQFFTIPLITHNPGDVNGDGIVDQLDLNVINGHWQVASNVWEDGDLTGDGLIDQLDLNQVNANWQVTYAPSAAAGLSAVPEPASLGLVAAAGTLLAVARRRRH